MKVYMYAIACYIIIYYTKCHICVYFKTCFPHFTFRKSINFSDITPPNFRMCVHNGLSCNHGFFTEHSSPFLFTRIKTPSLMLSMIWPLFAVYMFFLTRIYICKTGCFYTNNSPWRSLSVKTDYSSWWGKWPEIGFSSEVIYCKTWC